MSEPQAVELRYCSSCPAPHAENCPKCFGFGLVEGAPISADQAFADVAPAGWEACPVCDGKPVGKGPLSE